MRYCDLTFAYTATSGGIRTYIDQKRKYLLEHTDDEHVLIIPAAETSVEREGRLTTYRVACPLIPGCEPYRFFWRRDVLLDVLREAAPDVIELGSYFLEPWVAFRYRKEAARAGRRCVVGGYFHTDLADAYVGTPVKAVLARRLGRGNARVERAGARLSEWMAAGATQFFGAVFKRCDVMFAASAMQVRRLERYGVNDVHRVPLGVDLETFHPRRRSADVRSKLGVGAEETLLIFAGRLDTEKRVRVLVEAFAQLRLAKATLLLVGEGPARAELEKRAETLTGLKVISHEREPAALAELLASADIYVTAGPHETFALSVVEAQAAGLPVVGVSGGALIERVVPGTGLLAAVDDAKGMARAIEQVAADARAMGAAARRHVVDNGFGWSGTFERLFDAYGGAWSSTVVARRAERVVAVGRL